MLPALQCRLHPTAPGGVSPDPDAVSDPYGRGGTGWLLRTSATASDVAIPYGAGTCATPLADAAEFEFLAAPDEMNKQWYFSASPNVTTGGEVDAEFEWAGYGLQARQNFVALQTDKGSSGVAAAEYYRPNPCASAGGHPGLVCADEVARMLTLHRHQRFGTLQRHRGLYDVLTVSRESNGVVLDEGGYVVAAQDRVSDVSGGGGFAIVMYTTRDNLTRPVLVGEAALLSLGRAVMADPSWLGASFPGGVNASVRNVMLRYNFPLRDVTWSLRHDRETTNSSQWLSIELSQRYRRDLFRADPPEDPIPNGGLILSVLVVVPEAVAVLLLLLQRHGPLHRMFRWRWRNVLTLGLILVAGAIALVGVGYLDRQEQSGHAWRAATVRVGTRIHVNATEQKYERRSSINYRGRLTWHTESLIIVARTGYRPHVTRRLLVCSIIAYVLLAVAVLVQAVAAAWLWRRPPDADIESATGTSTPARPSNGLQRRILAVTPPAMPEGDPLPADDDGGGGDFGGGGRPTRGGRVPTQDGPYW
eukprot:contig_19693_g4848